MNSYVQVLEDMGRSENIDSVGGGTIIRQLYVEPYTAHKYVTTALKGTIDYSGSTAVRYKPHNDPLYDNYYCTDVKVDPWAREAATGGPTKAFVPNTNVTSFTGACQFTNIRTALDSYDDFDYDTIIDFAQNPPMSPSQIKVGNQGYGTDPVTSKGKCGAVITATYHPIHSISGWYGTPDPFDVLDPQINPIIKSTQLGRDLVAIASSSFSGNSAFNGISDTASVPETLLELSFRRIMVPYAPSVNITALVNRINSTPISFGNLFPNVPIGCVRADCPILETCVCPDSTLDNPKFFYNITLKFSIRIISAEYYDAPSSSFLSGRIDWNHQLCRPQFALVDNRKLSYYPVGWLSLTGGLGLWGGFRGIYLLDNAGDSSTGTPPPPGLIPNLWTKGFQSTD